MYRLYILKCAPVRRGGDGTLYTGITTDLKRRVWEHRGGKLGSKICRGAAASESCLHQKIQKPLHCLSRGSSHQIFLPSWQIETHKK